MLGYDDLRSFQKIVATGSLRKAAQSLNISQPSLSYTLKKIEDKLETSIFHRSQKGVSLTAPGLIFFKKVEELLDHWENLNCEVSKEIDRKGWYLTLGCHSSVAKYLLPEVLPKILANNPELKLQLKHDLSRKINDQVVASKIDFGLVINPVYQPELIIKPLCTDLVSLWESKDNKNKETLILDPDLAQTQWILRKLEKEGIRFKRMIPTDSLELIASLTLSGSGVGILPGRVLAKNKAVKRFLKEDISFKDTLCAVYRSEFRKKYIYKEILEAFITLFK